MAAATQKAATKRAAEAAYRQRVGETVDWLGSAKVALQVLHFVTGSVVLSQLVVLSQVASRGCG